MVKILTYNCQQNMEDLDLRWEEVDFDCEILTGEVDAAASVGRRQ